MNQRVSLILAACAALSTHAGCATVHCSDGMCETIKDGKATYEGPADQVALIEQQQAADAAWRTRFDDWRASAPARTTEGPIRVVLAGVTAAPKVTSSNTSEYWDEYWAWASEELARMPGLEVVSLTRRDVALAVAGNDLFTPARVKRIENGGMPSTRPPLSEPLLDYIRTNNKADLVLHMEMKDDAILGSSKRAGVGAASRASWTILVTDPWAGGPPKPVAEGNGKFQFTITATKNSVDKKKVDATLKKMGVDIGLWNKARDMDTPAFQQLLSTAQAGIRTVYAEGKAPAAAVSEWLAENPRPKHHDVPAVLLAPPNPFLQLKKGAQR